MLKTRVLVLFILILALAGFLRLYKLDSVPPALYSDEVSQGYNAYSVLTTGSDEYGEFLPLSFRSFGDWKPPLPAYLMVPFIYFFGLNTLSIRLPSATLGILSIVIVYLLSKELLRPGESIKEAVIEKISLAIMLFLAVSPWHIFQSRAAMLVMVAFFFLLTSVLCFLKGVRIDKKYWIVSSLSFDLAIYSYYGMRLVVPVMLIFLYVYFRTSIHNGIKHVCMPVFMGLLFLLPLLVAYIHNPNVIFGRVKTVSVFHDQGIALSVMDAITQDGIGLNTKIAEFIHNQPYQDIAGILRRFFEHLDGRFLFILGDQNPPFQIPGMGILYVVDGLLILIGMGILVKHEIKLAGQLIGLVFIFILPAALTYVTPASNRSFNLVFPLLMFGGFGFVRFFQNKHIFWKMGISCVYAISVFTSLNHYYLQLPQLHADWWHYGYKQLYEKMSAYEQKDMVINITGKTSVPYIFYLFYNKIHPDEIQDNIRRNFKQDEFGFEYVDSYRNFNFMRYFNWKEDMDRISRPSLLVVTPEEQVETNNTISNLTSVYTPDNREIFKIFYLK